VTVYSGSSAKKLGGRPKGSYGAKATAIREHVVELTKTHEVMTVRGVFYALVSRGVIPKEETTGYRPVQRVLLEMRHGGELPWSFIADGTRWQNKPTSWDDAEDALLATARSYRRNLWRDQGIRFEVWLEKDALAGVLSRVTDAWDVALMVSRGVSSASFLYSAVEQANQAAGHGIDTIIVTLFDYDAGGARARRMIHDYFDQYIVDQVEIVDVAITEPQIEEWNLPTRPAKKTDPQAKTWGDVAVELDAIPPDLLRRLVEDEIVKRIDPHAWNLARQYEQHERELLLRIATTERAS
jgi:hypothetical protein